MKTLKLIAVALLFSVILPASFAHATTNTFFNSYADFYTVGSNGSTTAQSSFSNNQTPYLFVEINNPAVSIPTTLTFISESNPSLTNIYSTATFSNSNTLWFNLDSVLNAPGTWTINGISYIPNSN